MAAEGSDETPLIFVTQTVATIADLDIEGLNPEEPTMSSVGSNVSLNTSVSRTMSSSEKTQLASGVSAPSPIYTESEISASMLDPGNVFSTAPSVVTGLSSVASVVPYGRSPKVIPPYNSNAMYEDSALPVYVDYIGNIMPILDRQSITSNWPPNPHPLTGQIRYVPFNRGNLPTVSYMMGVGSSLLPPPIRDQAALSAIAHEMQSEVVGDSVSQTGGLVSQAPVIAAGVSVAAFKKRQTKVSAEPLEREKLFPVDMELTVPYGVIHRTCLLLIL